MSKGRRCDFIMERNSDLSSLPSKNNEGILLFGHLTSKMGDLIFDYAQGYTACLQTYFLQPYGICKDESKDTSVHYGTLGYQCDARHLYTSWL